MPPGTENLFPGANPTQRQRHSLFLAIAVILVTKNDLVGTDGAPPEARLLEEAGLLFG